MTQFESLKAEFEKLEAQVWFIAAEKRRGMFDPEGFFRKQPSSFPFLLDEDRKVTHDYGVYHRMGIDAINIAHPATFIVGTDGKIKFIFVGESQLDRAPVDDIFKALANLK